MACSYNKNSEVYEKYILNRLSDDEKSDFEIHLNSCKNCQKRLEKEKWLQANLREIGKREMKTEIRTQVEMKRTEKNLADWGMILRVAAVILFVVITPGLIYYYQSMAPLPDQRPADKATTVESEESLTPLAESDQEKGVARRQVMSEKPLLSKLKKNEQEGKIVASARMKEMEDAQTEDIPAEQDVLAGQEIIEKSTRSKESLSDRILSPEAPIAGEIEKMAGRGEALATMADGNAVYRYDSDQPTINGHDDESMYYESSSLSESEVNQKTWLFRKSAREITMRLQLLDVKRDKDKELPQKIPAQIILQDSFRIMIECQVTPEFYEINPDSVTLYQPNPQILQIQLPRQVIYEIDLTKKSQEAVQIGP